MIALKIMWLELEHNLSTLTLEYSFLVKDSLCFQVHLRCPKLGVCWWNIVRFPLDKLRAGLKVKQAVVPPKQDIAVFFLLVKTASNGQLQNTMKAYSFQTFNHSLNNTVHPVLFL